MSPTPGPSDHALLLARQALPRRQAAGFQQPPVREAGALLCDDSDRHALVIAPTGAGKGRSVLLPWLLSYRGGAIVVDPKGEAARVTARCRREMGQAVCVIDPWQLAEGGAQAVNPLQVVLESSSDLGDDCLSLAELIVGEAPASSQDPFWRALALNLLAALIGWVWVRPALTGENQSDDRCLAGVWAMLHGDDLGYALAVLLDAHGRKPQLPPFVREGFVNFLHHEAEKVRTSVRSEAVSLLRIFGSTRVQAATASTTAPLGALRDGLAATIYLVVPPDRLESHAAYLRLMLGTLLSVMVRRTARPARPTLFLIDELGHLGPIPQLRQAVTLLRGYGVRVALFVQSMSQLRALWPREHETILENCGLWLNFGNPSLAAARQVADQLGDLSAEALFQLGAEGIAIHRAGEPTLLAQRLDYLTDPLFKGRYDAHPMHAGRRAGSGR